MKMFKKALQSLKKLFPVLFISLVFMLMFGFNDFVCMELHANPGTASTGAVSGLAHEAGTGTPLSGVFVTAKKRFDDGGDAGWDTTLASGDFYIANLVPGPYSLFAQKSGYGTAWRTNVTVLPNQQTPNQDLALHPNPGWVYGTVYDETMTALENVTVEVVVEYHDTDYWIGTVDATDLNGDYSLNDLSPDNTYKVAVRGSNINGTDYAKAVVSGIQILPGQGTEVNFTLQPAGKISGVVTNGSGQPLQDVRVDAWVEGGSNYGFELTDSSGAYSLEYLPVGLNYTVDFKPVPTTDYIIHRATVQVPNPQEYFYNIALDNGAISICGHISDAVTSNPVPFVTVGYWHNERQVPNRQFSDANGDYCLFNLAPGEAQLSVIPDSYYALDGLEQFFSTDDIVDFQLVEGGILNGVLKDGVSGSPILEQLPVIYTDYSRAISQRFDTDPANGTFEVERIAEGICFMDVRPHIASGYAFSQKTYHFNAGEVKSGEELFIYPAALLSGRLVDPYGVPIPHTSVKLKAVRTRTFKFGRISSVSLSSVCHLAVFIKFISAIMQMWLGSQT